MQTDRASSKEADSRACAVQGGTWPPHPPLLVDGGRPGMVV